MNKFLNIDLMLQLIDCELNRLPNPPEPFQIDSLRELKELRKQIISISKGNKCLVVLKPINTIK